MLDLDFSKENYIDQSMMYFDFLLESKQWSGITPRDYKNWIKNFDDLPDGTYIACKLLNHILYFSESDIIHFLEDAIQTIYYDVILEKQLESGFECMPSVLDYLVRQSIKKTVFVPLLASDSPGESGPELARILTRNQLVSTNMQYAHDIPNETAYRRLVIIDDNIGSGSQFRSFWSDAFIRGGKALSKWCGENDIKPYYLVIVGCNDSIVELQAEFPEVKFVCEERLYQGHRYFSSESRCWHKKDDVETIKNSLRVFLEEREISLLGFNDMDYGVVMHKTIPDWSLPLFYKRRDVWQPLLERKNSNE